MIRITSWKGACIAAATACGLAAGAAQAQDKVKMGLFIASSAMPYFIAAERGYFKAENLEVEGVPLATHPLIIQGMVKGDLDTASNLLSLEGANINALRPGTANYFSINCQNTKYQLEAFVVSAKNTSVKTLKDLKGQRIMVAPGPGNLFVARGVLKALGYEDGRDYTMQEQPMAQHIPGLQSGQFESAYTLEPIVSMLEHRGIARKIEAGVIATHMLGRPDACAVLAGGVMSDKFLKERPAVAEGARSPLQAHEHRARDRRHRAPFALPHGARPLAVADRRLPEAGGHGDAGRAGEEQDRRQDVPEAVLEPAAR
jgi:NitT/TauT family transport system substrate-binding protein